MARCENVGGGSCGVVFGVSAGSTLVAELDMDGCWVDLDLRDIFSLFFFAACIYSVLWE